MARTKTHHRVNSAGGFTLVELAVVLLIIVLLLGSILVPLNTQVDQRRYSSTEKQMEQIQDALVGFAIVNRYLPCPAVSATNGSEDRTGTECTTVSGSPKRTGFLPWVTLGLPPADAWNNLFRYSVAPGFTTSDVNSYFSLTTLAQTNLLQIRTRNTAGAFQNLTNENLPAVVISHGKNGYGGTAAGNAVVHFTPAGWAGDEQINATVTGLDPNLFVWRARTENTAATGGEFDDVLMWISPTVLSTRMVAAGRLP